MPSRREFLGAAASAPAWSLPFDEPLEHAWTHRTRDIVYPPLSGPGVLVAPVAGDLRSDTRPRQAIKSLGAEIGDVAGDLRSDTRPRLLGLDPPTGDVRWERLGSLDWNDRTTVGNRVVTADGDTVECVATPTGRAAWTERFGGERVSVSVQAVDIGPRGDVAYVTTARGVVALAVESGERLWSRDVEDARFHDATDSTAVLRTNERALAVDARTGETRWERAIPGGLTVVFGDVLVHTRYGDATAFDVETGEEVWAYDPTDASAYVIAGDERYVFVREQAVTYGVEEREFVVALSLDGEEVWRYRLPENATRVDVTDGPVVAFGQPEDGTDEPELVVIGRDSGRELWRDSAAYGYGLISASRGELRIPTADGVVARGVATGRERWRYGTEGESVYAAERGGRVYVGERRVEQVDSRAADAYQDQARRRFLLHAVDPPWSALAATRAWASRHSGALAALTGFGLVGVAAAGAGRWLRRHRVAGHVETVERTDAWTTACVENGAVRTEFRPDANATDAFVDACETWADRSDHAGVLALRDWGTAPSPWVETAPYAATLADGVDRERGLRAVSRAANALADLDRPHGALRPHAVAFPDDGAAVVRDVAFGSFVRAGWPDRDDAFAPPEDEASPAGDVYRLGALAYHVVVGDPPGDRASFETVDASVGDDLREVVTTALARDPADRYDSPARFADYLAWAAFAQETW